MVSIRRRFSLVGLVLLACGPAAAGGDYADPSGFSFTYPEGWVPITRAAMGDVNQFLPDELKHWVAKNQLDLNRLSVVLVRDGGDEFLENLNVVVEGQQIPVNDEAVRKLTEMITQQYRAMGVQVADLQGRVQKVGPYDAVVMEYRSRIPGVPDNLRQKQVMLPGGGKTYIITCTAKADSFDSYRPTFEKILASFRVPAPLATGIDWKRVVTAGVVAGVIGGLVGSLAWFGRKLLRKSGSSDAGAD